MAAVIHHVLFTQNLGGGLKLAVGKLNMDGPAGYATGGMACNLANYFKSNATIYLTANPANYAANHFVQFGHSGGTAAAGTIKAFVGDIGAAGNGTFRELNAGANLVTINTTFMALGEAF